MSYVKIKGISEVYSHGFYYYIAFTNDDSCINIHNGIPIMLLNRNKTYFDKLYYLEELFIYEKL